MRQVVVLSLLVATYFVGFTPFGSLAAEPKLTKPERVGMSSERLERICLLYTSPSPRDRQKSRMPSSA